jgi:hypothetical protein
MCTHVTILTDQMAASAISAKRVNGFRAAVILALTARIITDRPSPRRSAPIREQAMMRAQLMELWVDESRTGGSGPRLE